jgi:hypothetical protein
VESEDLAPTLPPLLIRLRVIAKAAGRGCGK